jgi:uncharacterized protein (UPF0332 family)
MTNLPKIKDVPYLRSDGKIKTANVIPVDFPTEGLSQEELKILDTLSDAVSGIIPIYAQQQDHRTIELFKTLEDVERNTADPVLREKIANFNILLAAKNSPFDREDYSIIFPCDLEQFPADHPIQKFKSLLRGEEKAPLARNLYPKDITDEEFEALGTAKDITNSTVVRKSDGSLEVILNEERFEKEANQIADHLCATNALVKDVGLWKYISAKFQELRYGTKTCIRGSDIAWLGNNTSKIDFAIGTGVETYLDRWKGLRGAAQGAVFVADKEYSDLSQKLLNLLPNLEANAPWKHKKEVSTENLTRLKYVNVLNWAGFYDWFPMLIAAESLPNDKEVTDKYGSVNVVFVNIQKAVARSGAASALRKEFFLEREMAKYEAAIPDSGILLTSVHELGHTTGGTTLKEDPQKYFGKEYSVMEEARADLFAMWSLPTLLEKGIISDVEETAAYYHELQGLLFGLAFNPTDHNGARNMIFHYLRKEGAIETHFDENNKYVVNVVATRQAVPNMLAKLSDIKAEGDLEGLAKFKQEYISTEQQEYFQKRTENLPLGRCLIFPKLEHDGEKYTGKLTYPTDFRDQQRTLRHTT